MEKVFKCRRCNDKFGYRYTVKSRKFTQQEGWFQPARATVFEDIASVVVELFCNCGKPLLERDEANEIKSLIPHRKVSIAADIFYDNPNQLKIWEA